MAFRFALKKEVWILIERLTCLLWFRLSASLTRSYVSKFNKTLKKEKEKKKKKNWKMRWILQA